MAKDIDEPYECSQKIRQLLRDPLSNSPDFKTIHEMTKWVEQRIPSQLSARFIEAGRTVSRTLEDWERHGMIHGPFWNTQALSELLIAQSDHFVGLAGCSKQDEFGVTFQVLKDQLYIPLNVESKPVEKVLEELGVSDSHYAKMAIMYGVILDFAKVAWRDEQVAQVAKFRLEPLITPPEARAFER